MRDSGSRQLRVAVLVKTGQNVVTEPGEFLQWLYRDDIAINIVEYVTAITYYYYAYYYL